MTHKPPTTSIIAARLQRASTIEKMFNQLLDAAAKEDYTVNGYSELSEDPATPGGFIFSIHKVEVFPPTLPDNKQTELET